MRLRESLVCAVVLVSSLTVSACSGPSPGTSAMDAAADAPDGAVGPVLDAGPEASAVDPAWLLPPGAVTFAQAPPFGGDAGAARDGGASGFVFGVATAATQMEDQNTQTDWYVWTQPADAGGLGKSAFVGDAVQGWSRRIEDIARLRELHVDAYRFSIEWARIEPQRDRVDTAALAGYGQLLDALRTAGIRPYVTLYHFSNPLWVDDPRASGPCTPSDTNLCGWDSPTGADAVIEEIAEHAALLARTYGDRVDDWATFNEPVNGFLAAYGLNFFPPGRNLLLSDFDRLVAVYRNVLRAHAAMYDAIRANDTVDADGDGTAARIGLTLNVAHYEPSRNNQPSTRPEDIAARDRLVYVYHWLFVDSLRNGAFDANLDQTAEEPHPEWRNKLDWLGLQYYFRTGVSAVPAVIPRLNVNVCAENIRLGACLPPLDPTHWVPTMGYEFYAPGIHDVLVAFSSRYQGLPLAVTEAGIATEVGRRRAENVVRTLEQIERARREGVDVRGYFHWSLMDNFEWAHGYVPRFGLFRVDRTTSPYTRTLTEGGSVFAAIAQNRQLTLQQRTLYGGLGPMTPEPGP